MGHFGGPKQGSQKGSNGVPYSEGWVTLFSPHLSDLRCLIEGIPPEGVQTPQTLIYKPEGIPDLVIQTPLLEGIPDPGIDHFWTILGSGNWSFWGTPNRSI